MLFFPKEVPLRISLDSNVTIYPYYWRGKRKQDNITSPHISSMHVILVFHVAKNSFPTVPWLMSGRSSFPRQYQRAGKNRKYVLPSPLLRLLCQQYLTFKVVEYLLPLRKLIDFVEGKKKEKRHQCMAQNFLLPCGRGKVAFY